MSIRERYLRRRNLLGETDAPDTPGGSETGPTAEPSDPTPANGADGGSGRHSKRGSFQSGPGEQPKRQRMEGTAAGGTGGGFAFHGWRGIDQLDADVFEVLQTVAFVASQQHPEGPGVVEQSVAVYTVLQQLRKRGGILTGKRWRLPEVVELLREATLASHDALNGTPLLAFDDPSSPSQVSVPRLSAVFELLAALTANGRGGKTPTASPSEAPPPETPPMSVASVGEPSGPGGGVEFLPTPTSASNIEALLSAPSARGKESTEVIHEVRRLLSEPTARETSIKRTFQSDAPGLREFCKHRTRVECGRVSPTGLACSKVHFRRVVLPHTDISLGDCSYLDTCRHMDTCRFVHYDVDAAAAGAAAAPPRASNVLSQSKPTAGGNGEPFPPQWIRCDIRRFQFPLLGESQVKVIMADPPWDIHMELPYGTMTDNEMRNLRVDQIHSEGLIFLWVTGRAMEIGRECMRLWGYEKVDEIVWVKTNQLQRIIRTGRTGHWLNHSKEHCLVGIKGNPKINRRLDADVIVAEVRETSRKPDEIYRLIDCMVPGGLKVELFGRAHNVRKNWLTLGNQLNAASIAEPALRKRYNAAAASMDLVESRGVLSSPFPPAQ